MVKYLHLNDINSYKTSFELSNFVWNIVITWNNLAKYTVGQQFINAIDSVSANIAEGFGRYHKKDKIKFYYNSRASVYESLDWLQKAKVRKLITSEEYQKVFSILQALPKEINSLINYTNSHLSV
ncbi:hypothetical protein A2773_02205 [Candidatus Gottesmanbacteria bacterium RIFCSPHIGHO2_01_FULL_39_10]|uniref:Four helix bundle protein n=1 Tax=Candidatus Gottesmanbacteria bacterium RIFCSPHIGHO2_01_FULL_39_10 TaxID=1798375 RepID=A0A1F5ZR56_9BACT|nr:MAG: hypothetical protein A2773_02205 [Candidatus Gottesmanbacteria bacterium RIFCSPHIGHO2_01_FULL_39_10]